MLEGSCLSDYSAGKREERERLLWRGNCREAKDKADIKTAGLTCHDAAVAFVCTLSLTVLVVLVVGVVVVRRWSTSSSLTNPPLLPHKFLSRNNLQLPVRLHGPIFPINPAHFGRFDSILTLELLFHGNLRTLVISISIFLSP